MKLIPEAKEAKKVSAWVTTQMLPLVVPFTEAFADLIFLGPVQVNTQMGLGTFWLQATPLRLDVTPIF